MGNKPIYFSFQARIKCGWGSKCGGNVYICKWFMGMGCANKESEIQNDTNSREGKMDPGRMSVIVQLTRKQSEVRVNFHPLWRQGGKSLNTFPSTFCWWDFGGIICCALQFFKSIFFACTLVTHNKYATYSLMRFSLVSAIVLLRALNPWGIPGDTLVTVPEPTNQCTDTQPYSPSSPEIYCRIKGSQKEEDYSCFSQGSATLFKD